MRSEEIHLVQDLEVEIDLCRLMCSRLQAGKRAGELEDVFLPGYGRFGELNTDQIELFAYELGRVAQNDMAPVIILRTEMLVWEEIERRRSIRQCVPTA